MSKLIHAARTQPDVLIGLTAVDSPHRRGARILAKLPEAVERAAALRN
jgi:hypothetical protein